MSTAVYLDYDQAQLDAQYDQRTLVPDPGPYLERWHAESGRAGEALAPERAIPYGDTAAEVLDVFRPANPSGRLHVHYHGGAWRLLESRDAWFLAPAWVAAGYTFVSVNFALVPEVSLATQVDQARRALAWCERSATRLGGEPGRISVSGHSSGAHLAAMAGLADWGRPQPEVHSVLLASGVYDLEPVRLSSRNEYLRLNAARARSLSPLLALVERAPACRVLWSNNELAEFQRQSKRLVDTLAPRGPVRGQAVGVTTHFDTWDLVTPCRLGPTL